MLVSSANIKDLLTDNAFETSLTYIKNNNGRKIEPRGTPKSMLCWQKANSQFEPAVFFL